MKYRENLTTHRKANITLAEKFLDWTPKINLEEGESRLVDWYMEERDWASQIVTN
jgi:nucleoside-diphosphate-sugar epimerase